MDTLWGFDCMKHGPSIAPVTPIVDIFSVYHSLSHSVNFQTSDTWGHRSDDDRKRVVVVMGKVHEA